MSCIITIYNMNDPVLKLDCFNDNNRLVHSIALLQIYEHEIELNSGRFKLYVDKIPVNKVFVRHDSTKDIPITEWIRSMIGWINEVNKKGNWSFNGRMLDNNRSEFEFGFDDLTVCFAFAMAWV